MRIFLFFTFNLYQVELFKQSPKVLDNTINPLLTIRELISPYLDKAEKVVATGYGRNLAKINLGTEAITEIKAQALGIIEIFS